MRLMVAAFEEHAAEILAKMRDPAVHLDVTRILVTGTDRPSDREVMKLAAGLHLGLHGFCPALLKDWF
jgi:predicted dinucleotide-binding enzyme